MSADGELCDYERKRLNNIAGNQQHLISLGIEKAAAAIKKPVTKPVMKRAREKAPPTKTRGSRRLQGEAADAEGEADEPQAFVPRAQPLKRASTEPRLTAEQSARLDALEEQSAGPLTAEELEAVEYAREHLEENGGGNWTSKRAVLEEAAEIFGLRWPTWLSKIEQALPKMGDTKSAQDQTMYKLQRAACGLGFTYEQSWPEGVGILLANDVPLEGEVVHPRVLTLGSDTETLKREGQRLEAKFGRDAGNGWAYNHHLGKVRAYQMLLLGPEDQPSAPSIYELENGQA